MQDVFFPGHGRRIPNGNLAEEFDPRAAETYGMDGEVRDLGRLKKDVARWAGVRYRLWKGNQFGERWGGGWKEIIEEAYPVP